MKVFPKHAAARVGLIAFWGPQFHCKGSPLSQELVIRSSRSQVKVIPINQSQSASCEPESTRWVISTQVALWGGGVLRDEWGLHLDAQLQKWLPPERWPLAEGIRRDYKQ